MNTHPSHSGRSAITFLLALTTGAHPSALTPLDPACIMLDLTRSVLRHAGAGCILLLWGLLNALGPRPAAREPLAHS